MQHAIKDELLNNNPSFSDLPRALKISRQSKYRLNRKRRLSRKIFHSFDFTILTILLLFPHTATHLNAPLIRRERQVCQAEGMPCSANVELGLLNMNRDVILGPQFVVAEKKSKALLDLILAVLGLPLHRV